MVHRLLCVLFAILWCRCASAGQPEAGAEPAAAAPAERSNAELIAAMGHGLESVMVARVSRLAAPDSVWAELSELATGLSGADVQELEGEFSVRAVREAASAGITAVALGGGDFVRPHGFGVGDYARAYIACTGRPLTALRERLERDEKPEGTEVVIDVRGVRLYQSIEMVANDVADEMAIERGHGARTVRFTAVLGEHTLIVADRRDIAEFIIWSLSAHRTEMPRHWSGVGAEVPASSPLVILRRYDRTNVLDAHSPFNLVDDADGRVDFDSVALWIESEREPAVELRAITSHAGTARAFFEEEALPSSHFRGRIEARPEGLGARLEADLGEETRSETILYFLPFFGVNIAM